MRVAFWNLARRIVAEIVALLSCIRQFYWRCRLGRLGTGSVIRSAVKIYRPRHVSIGENVTLNNFVLIWGEGTVTIGDHTMVASHTVVTTQTHDVDALAIGKLYRETNVSKAIHIGRNVWIGSNVTILPGVTIGDNAIVGAGAVVSGDVDSNTLVVGVPARPLRMLL